MPHSEGWVVLLEKDEAGTGDSCTATPDPVAFRNLRPVPPPRAKVDKKVTFKPTENGKYTCHLQIENITEGCSIIFKIKTTSPDLYRVRPAIGVIEAGGIAQVPITTQEELTAAEIRSDRFLVQVCLLPTDMLDEGSCDSQSLNKNPNHSDLNNIFKILESYSVDTSFQVAADVWEPVQAAAPPLTRPVVTKPLNFNGLENKTSDSVLGKIGTKLDILITLLFLVLLFLALLSAMMLMRGPQPVEVNCTCLQPSSTCGWGGYGCLIF